MSAPRITSRRLPRTLSGFVFSAIQAFGCVAADVASDVNRALSVEDDDVGETELLERSRAGDACGSRSRDD